MGSRGVRRSLVGTVMTVVTLVACGGGGGSGAGGGGSATFDCSSSCPMDPAPVSQSVSCEGTANPPCAYEFAAFMQCEHDDRVCDSSGYTDYEKTDALCANQKSAWENCLSCGSGDCPDATPLVTVDAGGG